MHCIIIGRDGSDAGALERRMQVREAHMRGVDELVQQKRLLYAAAMLDDAGAMIGSIMIVDFASREELDRYLEKEPYVTGNVWQSIDVTPCRIPPVFLK
jgi:hypothetical protein